MFKIMGLSEYNRNLLNLEKQSKENLYIYESGGSLI